MNKPTNDSELVAPFLISVLASVTIVVHQCCHWQFDQTDTALIIIAASPWLALIFKSIKLPGGFEVAFNDLKQTQASIKTAQTQQQHQLAGILEFLTEHFLTKNERRHLEKLERDQEYRFTFNKSSADELRRLRDLGFIESTDGATLNIGETWKVHAAESDLRQRMKISNLGKRYLGFYHQSIAAEPSPGVR